VDSSTGAKPSLGSFYFFMFGPRSRYTLLVALVSLAVACASEPTPQAKSVESIDPPTPSFARREQLEAEKVWFALRGSENDFRKCFMRSMNSRGLVETRFEMSDRGEVEKVEALRSTIDRKDVVDCVEQRLLAHNFGLQDGPKWGKWTFVFRLAEAIPDSKYKARLQRERHREPLDGVVVDPSSPGTLDPGRIEGRVAVKYPLFAGCYRASLDRRGRFQGVLRLRLDIDARGSVLNVQDGGSVMPDPFAIDCIAEGFYAMEFPKPELGAVHVRYRLDFE
jgi:hypothetical protein